MADYDFKEWMEASSGSGELRTQEETVIIDYVTGKDPINIGYRQEYLAHEPCSFGCWDLQVTKPLA